MLKNILNFILLLVLVVIVGTFLNEVLDYAIKKDTVVKCYQLNDYDKQFESFWVSEKDADMCKEAGVPLTAQVKTAEELKEEGI